MDGIMFTKGNIRVCNLPTLFICTNSSSRSPSATSRTLFKLVAMKQTHSNRSHPHISSKLHVSCQTIKTTCQRHEHCVNLLITSHRELWLQTTISGSAMLLVYAISKSLIIGSYRHDLFCSIYKCLNQQLMHASIAALALSALSLQLFFPE